MAIKKYNSVAFTEPINHYIFCFNPILSILMSCVSEGPSLALRLALVGLSFPFNLQKMPRHHSKLGGKKTYKELLLSDSKSSGV